MNAHDDATIIIIIVRRIILPRLKVLRNQQTVECIIIKRLKDVPISCYYNVDINSGWSALINYRVQQYIIILYYDDIVFRSGGVRCPIPRIAALSRTLFYVVRVINIMVRNVSAEGLKKKLIKYKKRFFFGSRIIISKAETWLQRRVYLCG